jgi:hypothetical protein
MKLKQNPNLRVALALTVLLLFTGPLYPQKTEISILAGAAYGGPIPRPSSPDAKGQPHWGPQLSLSFDSFLGQKAGWGAQLQWAYSSLNYSDFYRRDTIVTIQAGGQDLRVPTYYTANVDGKMRHHYIYLHLFGFYQPFPRNRIFFGPYLGYLAAADDPGIVRIVIGQGGLLPDINESFNNSDKIHRMEFGVSGGGRIFALPRLFVGILASRSFFNMYKPSFYESTRNNQKGLFFNTYVHLSVGYIFSRPGKTNTHE